ncbi:MAG TPA: transglutaminase-like domain-containing protein, partial [Gemmatales bacterium]|nr:transglutaminase-like domain-containing protein [Gemmatales bacterium]
TDEVLAKANLTSTSPARERAKALEQYLSGNEYAYSLERRRQDTNIDPTEDFLFNVKEGHCERFASALVLLLRAQGIPARIVIGYRGLEWNDIGNYYIVRQYHAHAWVEAIIDERTDRDGRRILTWLVLDASPARDVNSEESGYAATISFARFLWEFFILDFAGQAQRARLMARLQHTWIGKFIAWWNTLNAQQALAVVLPCLIVSVGLVYGLLVLRNRWRSRKFRQLTRSVISVPFFEQLLQLLSRKGIRPQLHETAQEFASGAEKKLAQKPATAPVAQLPSHIIPPYYAVRFGGNTLASDEQQLVEDQLRILKTALGQ